MAATTFEKLQELVQCPTCLEKLARPILLGCHHFYCQNCCDGLPEKIQDEQLGCECPLCHRFSPKLSLKPLIIMTELLDVFSQVKIEGCYCVKCKTEVPRWRCLDCKEGYCKSCRSHHDDFKLFKSHKWEAFGNSTKPVVDKIVYCDVHVTEPVKIHCRDCRMLICLLCNCTIHNKHTAETIEEALDNVIPVVKEHQARVKTLIKVSKLNLTQGRRERAEAKAKYDVIRIQIDAKFEQSLKKLNEEYALIKREVDTLQGENLSKRDRYIRNLELKLRSQESALNLSESTLATAQNTSLLMAIQSGILESLQSSCSSLQNPTPVDMNIQDTVFRPFETPSANCLGEIDTFISYTNLSKMAIALLSEHELDFKSLRFSCVNNELWCVEKGTNYIHVLSLDGDKIREILLDRIPFCHSVAALGSRVIIAAANGLFVASTVDCTDIKKVAEGGFDDVSIQGDLLYALDRLGEKVHMIEFSGVTDAFDCKRIFDMIHLDKGYLHTIETSNTHAYISRLVSKCIDEYTMEFELIQTHGNSGPNLVGLQSPSLSGCDVNGDLLVTGCDKGGLKILLHDGTCQELRAEGLGKDPVCARIIDRRLYVMCIGSQTLQIFTIN